MTTSSSSTVGVPLQQIDGTAVAVVSPAASSGSSKIFYQMGARNKSSFRHGKHKQRHGKRRSSSSTTSSNSKASPSATKPLLSSPPPNQYSYMTSTITPSPPPHEPMILRPSPPISPPTLLEPNDTTTNAAATSSGGTMVYTMSQSQQQQQQQQQHNCSHSTTSNGTHATPTTQASTTTSPNSCANGESTSNSNEGTAIALDYSSHACVCLQEEDLEGALTWYQRALIVYQTEAAEAKDPPLGIVDTCNAAATLHNMGAVYNALQQGDAALQCYHDAEQLYRECRQRLAPPSPLPLAALEEQETVCLTALIAETLHHRASIYETSVWDSVAALECHEACVELLAQEPAILLHDNHGTLSVTCVDDVFFQQECLQQVQLQWLVASYQSLAKLYRQSDTPQDGLVALQSWKTLLEQHLSQPNLTQDIENEWRKSLVECWKQFSEFYFCQQEMTKGVDALHTAMDLQLQTSGTKDTAKVLSHDLLNTMNSMGRVKEERGHYQEALICYEKILLIVSRYLGEDHWEVAEALVKIGRVMECQGNVAGGLDLYHAAHTIYQASVKDDDEYDDSYESTRAATESVVRIANVLMGQKRWREAVDFLRELPQTKMLWWLDSDNSDDENNNNNNKGNNSIDHKAIPSVHQAIVFRELGRAYMGMGELAKAKQCLLESARRLEGTDHEEDVFELLMHVEFCQKQERMAALATAKNRLRSRSRSRSRARSSSNSRTASSGSDLEERGRITKDAVAAVLSPSMSNANTSEESPKSADPPTPPVAVRVHSESPKNEFVQSPSPKVSPGASPAKSDSIGRSPTPVLSPMQQDFDFVADSNDLPLVPFDRANHNAIVTQKSQSTESSTPPPPPVEQPPVNDDHEDDDEDEKSLGSLDTQSAVDEIPITNSPRPTTSRALTPMPTSNAVVPVEGEYDDSVPFDVDPFGGKDSFQVQRAKDIILKRVKLDNEMLLGSPSAESGALIDDGQSDVVSSVLVGLDIDIDHPPPSTPTSKDEASVRSVKKSITDLVLAKTASSEKPFDEATQASSKEKPFDEHSGPHLQQQRKLNAAAIGQLSRNPMSFKERMATPTPDDESTNGQTNTPLVAASLSDLTSTYGGQSSASSVNEQHKTSGYLPPLLQSPNDEDENPFNIPPPPPPPPVPSKPPAQIETLSKSPKQPASPTSQTSKHGLSDGIIQISVAHENGEKSKVSSFDAFFPEPDTSNQANNNSFSPSSKSQRSPVLFDPTPKERDFQRHEDDDDASSDPFEGYEDFDADDSESDVTPSYSGDSESEQGYTRFAREDFSSGDEDSAPSDDDGEDPIENDADRDRGRDPAGLYRPSDPKKHKHKIIIYDDSRQPSQLHDLITDPFSSGERESPVPSVSQNNVHNTFSSDPLDGPKRDSSPTFEVHDNDDATPKESQSHSTPSPRNKKSKSHGSEMSKSSPGNRIVRALSNSIRLRRKTKAGRSSKHHDQFEALQTDAEAEATVSEGMDDSPMKDSLPSSLTKPNQSAREDEAEKTDAAVEELEGDDTLGRPIQFVSLASQSHDDTLSQITFIMDDPNVKNRNKNNQWWGQLGQLDGWLPNFHQAVEAAEGFLSAKAIHAQMKSQPLDFDSEDEDEEDTNDDLIIRESSTLPLAASTLKTEVVAAAACSPIPNSFFQSSALSSKRRASTATTSVNSTSSKIGPVSLEQSVSTPKVVPPSTPTQQVTPAANILQSDSLSVVPNKNEIALEIEQQEKLLAQYELEALNDDKANHRVGATLFRMSILYLQSEEVEEALKATNEALRIQKYRGDSADAARSLHLLADIFVRKGEYDSALGCYAEVQEMELALYGYIHEESANTLNRIGSVLARQSKFSLAMEKHQEALRILKECHGEELRHPLVSQTLIHIGAVYYRERNSLSTVRAKSDDYSTFIEVGMLEVIGRAHEDRGSYKMAISFFEEKLQCLNQKRTEGKANLEEVATTLNSLGMLSCRAGIFMEAIDYYDRALEVQKQIGCDKMHIATARVLTATVQFHLGFFQKALRLLQDALKELKAETGEDHETVAATWFQIGVVQVALCEYDNGMDALEEALRIQNNLLGKVHPATLRTRREIGNMYAIYESELDAAFAQFRDILATQRRIHGYKHPNVAETLHSLGCAYARKGDYPNATKTLEECYYMRIDFLGADHPLQATTLHELAEIHRKRQRFRKAKHICNAVLEIRRESLSERHIDVSRALATKASCLVATGDYTNAMKCLREALPMAEQAVGERHPAVADILVHLGGIHLRKCHFEEAKEWINKALDIYHNSNLDEDHPSLKEAVALMERVDRDEMLCV
ncbi:Clustered mitochondria protein homolog [Seminavis robusta]|uniref:Clustered mitochondria protein homolog n=1 Tax=Seminavis robusta TaxID=568900 RepID=A0A9N8HCJ0_9STRA|nr:Clustered mitochondria protein homolog [Seminavis robusta]|eukprot:Sro304_g112570.1 Clustered mitochondria protein homolog (2302) ;mRNA; r:24214-31209